MGKYIDLTVTPSRESRANKFAKANKVRKEGGGMAGAGYLCGKDGCAATVFWMNRLAIHDRARLHLHGGGKLQ